MASAVTGVILAGGESRRMGQDKAHLPWGDRTVIEHIIETLRPLTDEIIVVAKDAAPLSHLHARIVEDLVPDAHALGGLYTGLALAAQERCFVCACDMPFLNPRLIRFLAGQITGYELVIPRSVEGLQPLHAVYAKSALQAIEGQLNTRHWDLGNLVFQLDAYIIEPEIVAQHDPEGRSCVNINTPHEYSQAAEAL